MSLSHEDQLRQIAGADGINKLMLYRGWPDDGLIKAYPSEILGNVLISYLDGHGRSHNVECAALKLKDWLLDPRPRPRRQMLIILDAKVQKDAQA